MLLDVDVDGTPTTFGPKLRTRKLGIWSIYGDSCCEGRYIQVSGVAVGDQLAHVDTVCEGIQHNLHSTNLLKLQEYIAPKRCINHFTAQPIKISINHQLCP